MSDWQVGDLAVCLRTGRRNYPDHDNWTAKGGLRVNCVYLVEDVINWHGQIGLVVAARSPHSTGAWDHRQFRRVPPHKADEFDHEVIGLLTNNPAKIPEHTIGDGIDAFRSVAAGVHNQPNSEQVPGASKGKIGGISR